MIKRTQFDKILDLLREFPAVGLLGPRQTGKTTLALAIADKFEKEALYLDLERPSDLARLQEAESYFELHQGKLIILDEVQRMPAVFNILRTVIDQQKRKGIKAGQFLVLGSSSLELLQQSAESLAGRIAYTELGGFTVEEIPDHVARQDQLWLRGGFPDSYLSATDAASFRWRQQFISTYLERDVPMLGPRIPAVTLRRLWTMLAHQQGQPLNIAKLASNLDVSAPTVRRYIELLEDLLLIRSLRPWAINTGKRLVKAPKIYIRDSGLTHSLLNIETMDDLLSHPVLGASWEAFVMENLLAVLPDTNKVSYYRTGAGAEIDLVVEKKRNKIYAIEIKRSLSPSVTKGFHIGAEDIPATERFLVYPGEERYPVTKSITAISVFDMMRELKNS